MDTSGFSTYQHPPPPPPPPYAFFATQPPPVPLAPQNEAEFFRAIVASIDSAALRGDMAVDWSRREVTVPWDGPPVCLKVEKYDPAKRRAIVDVIVFDIGDAPAQEPLGTWIDCQGRVGCGAGSSLTRRDSETYSEKELRRAQKGQRVHYFTFSPHAASGVDGHDMVLFGRHVQSALKLDDVYLSREFRRLDQVVFFAAALDASTRRVWNVWSDVVKNAGWKGMLQYFEAKSMLTRHGTPGVVFDDGTEKSREIWIPFPGLDGMYIVVNYDKVDGKTDIDLKVVLTVDAPPGVVVDMRHAGMRHTAGSLRDQSDVKSIVYADGRKRTLTWRHADTGMSMRHDVEIIQVVQIDDLPPPVDLTLFYVDTYFVASSRAPYAFSLAHTPLGPPLAKHLNLMLRRGDVGAQYATRPALAQPSAPPAPPAPRPPPTAP